MEIFRLRSETIDIGSLAGSKAANADNRHRRHHCIALVGGGAAAVSFCLQLFDKLERNKHFGGNGSSSNFLVKIYVFEAGERIGPGKVYEKNKVDCEQDGANLLNVPKQWMSPIAGERGHFHTWLMENNRDTDTDFPPRSAFGDYLAAMWSDLLERTKSAPYIKFIPVLGTTVDEIKISRAQPVSYSIHYSHGRNRLEADENMQPRPIYADSVVFCVGALPVDSYRHMIGHAGYAHDWSSKEAIYAELTGDEAIGILGTKLTAIDVALELKARGHRGPIWMASRTGLLPAVNNHQRHITDDNVNNGNDEEEENSGKNDGTGWASCVDCDNLTIIQERSIFSRVKRIEKNFRLLQNAIFVGGEKGQNLLEAIKAYIYLEYCTLHSVIVGNEGEQIYNRYSCLEELCEWMRSVKSIDWLNHQIGECEKGQLRPWQFIMWAIYPILQDLWQTLGPSEKAEFSTDWMTIFKSFYAAFPVENARKIREMLQNGQLSILRDLGDVQCHPSAGQKFILEGRVEDELADSTELGQRRVIVDCLFNATGPGSSCTNLPLIAALVRRGLAAVHPFGGLVVDNSTLRIEPIQTDNPLTSWQSEDLYALGELTKGEFFATTCMAKVAEQADLVATHFEQKLAILSKNFDADFE